MARKACIGQNGANIPIKLDGIFSIRRLGFQAETKPDAGKNSPNVGTIS
jgi:hypothetical protein